jgi:hypothetical protein
MKRAIVASTIAFIGAAVSLTAVTARWTSLHWGATVHEAEEELPGDDHVGAGALTATRAITIDAPPDRVWPWIAQLGQGRGGFYSYDWLENLVGCDIHSADTIVEPWQHVEPGDPVRLHPELALTVASVEPGHSLVLHGAPPAPTGEGRSVGKGEGEPPKWAKEPGGINAFTWTFVVRKHPAGTTRLLVRERYAVTSRWARLFLEPVTAVSSVMSQKMLRGIRDRAEATPAARTGPVPLAT